MHVSRFVRLVAVLFALAFTNSCYEDPEQGFECVTAEGVITVTYDFDQCDKFRSASASGGDALRKAIPASFEELYPYSVSLHPESNGTSWPPNEAQRADRYTAIFGETVCKQRLIILASFDWTRLQARNVLCHEMGHAMLGCGPFDHDAMRIAALDARCNEENQKALYGNP